MEIRKTNISKNFLTDGDLLISKIRHYQKYFDKKTIEYLFSLVNLEETVFKDLDLSECFGSTNLFFEIAKHNICYRTIETIEHISSIENDKMQANFFGDSLSISYKVDENYSFCVLGSNLSKTDFGGVKPKKPSIYIYNANDNPRDKIEAIRESIEQIKRCNLDAAEQLAEFNKLGVAINQSIYGGPDSKRYFENEHKIRRLENEIYRLIRFGVTEQEVKNAVCNALDNDWNLEYKVHNKELVKKLSWIDIYKSSK